MTKVERFTSMSDVEVAHLSSDAAWVESTATADAPALSDLGE